MLDKAFYFTIGKKFIKVSLPENGLSRCFTIAMIGILLFDIYVGNLFGVFLMSLFIAMNTVEMR